VDQATDTVYVTISGSNTVAVFNGATCNSRVTRGCRKAAAHVRVGPAPFGIFADDANHTVYVANPGPDFSKDTISMINTLTCNASDLRRCARQRPRRVPVAVAPGDFDVNQATHTVYVATGPGVAALNARTCNARVLSGCGHIGMLPDPQAPIGVFAVKADSANNTIYAANGPASTISAFDGRTCKAGDLAGCAAEKPGIVTVAPPDFFEVAFWLVVDAPLHTVYVVNQKDDTLSAVDTRVCTGRHLPACATLLTDDHQSIYITSDPPGAACRVREGGKMIGVVSPTPGTILVGKSRHDIAIDCTRAGYYPGAAVLQSHFQDMTYGNILYGGSIGLLVDTSSGAIREYPRWVSVLMKRQPRPGCGVTWATNLILTMSSISRRRAGVIRDRGERRPLEEVRLDEVDPALDVIERVVESVLDPVFDSVLHESIRSAGAGGPSVPSLRSQRADSAFRSAQRN
jgi:DNA-binding beta-propeller fold protein YncE